MRKSLVKKGSLHPTVGLHGAARPVSCGCAARRAGNHHGCAAGCTSSFADSRCSRPSTPTAAAQGRLTRRVPPRLEQADRAARRGGHGGGAPRVRPDDAKAVAGGGTFVVGNWECELGAAVPVDRFDSGAVLAAAPPAPPPSSRGGGPAARAPFKPVVAGAGAGALRPVAAGGGGSSSAARPLAAAGRPPPPANASAATGGGGDRRRPRPQRGRKEAFPVVDRSRVRAAGARAKGSSSCTTA